MRRRRSVESKGPDMGRWLLTYSDMITLLMIFFITMYVISNVNMEKFRALAENLSITLRGTPAGLLPDGAALLPGQGGEAAQMAQIEAELKEYLEKQNLRHQVTVRQEERGLVISFQETILFAKGSATLTPEARRVISRVGNILKEVPNYIRVEGHTCDLPINTPQFPSNWELSSARATNVVRELITASGIPPERLSATGYGEYRPRYPNDTEEHRQLNRRIDILILRTEYRQVEPE